MKLFIPTVFVSVLFFGPLAQAQLKSSSPFSIYGYGQKTAQNNSSIGQAGGLHSSFQSAKNNQANFVNPAANQGLNTTTFEVDAQLRYSLLDGNYFTGENSPLEKKANTGGISNLSLAFPLGDKVKAGIALRSFSSVYSKEQVTTNENFLDGGLNNLEAFVSYNISPEFALGLGSRFVFGNIKQSFNTSTLTSDEMAKFKISGNDIITAYVTDVNKSNIKTYATNPENMFTYQYEGQKEETSIYKKESYRKNTYNGFGFKLGASYKKELADNRLLTAGIAYAPKTKLNTSFTSYKEYTQTIDVTATLKKTKTQSTKTSYITQRLLSTETIKDDVLSGKSSTYLPQQLNVGVSYGKKNNWSVGIETEFESTSDFQFTGSDFQFTEDRFRLSTGAWWIPNSKSYKKYFKTVTYSTGLYYEKTPLKINGNQIIDYGLNLGTGFPIGKKRDYSQINLGLNIGQYTDSDLVKETYTHLTFGVVLNADWFKRREFD